MDVLQMPAKVSALGESLLAFRAAEGSQTSMLSEVVAEIAALLEGAGTAWILTLKKELNSLSVRVLDLDGLVPFLRNSFKMLRSKVLMRLNPILMIGHVLIFVFVIRLVLIDLLTHSIVLCLARIARGVNFDWFLLLIIFSIEFDFLGCQLVLCGCLFSLLANFGLNSGG